VAYLHDFSEFSNLASDQVPLSLLHFAIVKVLLKKTSSKAKPPGKIHAVAYRLTIEAWICHGSLSQLQEILLRLSRAFVFVAPSLARRIVVFYVFVVFTHD
jgi:hypothetical protein